MLPVNVKVSVTGVPCTKVELIGAFVSPVTLPPPEVPPLEDPLDELLLDDPPDELPLLLLDEPLLLEELVMFVPLGDVAALNEGAEVFDVIVLLEALVLSGVRLLEAASVMEELSLEPLQAASVANNAHRAPRRRDLSIVTQYPRHINCMSRESILYMVSIDSNLSAHRDVSHDRDK